MVRGLWLLNSECPVNEHFELETSHIVPAMWLVLPPLVKEPIFLIHPIRLAKVQPSLLLIDLPPCITRS